MISAPRQDSNPGGLNLTVTSPTRYPLCNVANQQTRSSTKLSRTVISSKTLENLSINRELNMDIFVVTFNHDLRPISGVISGHNVNYVAAGSINQ